jgi:two-component system response regulator PilR (NtrC family)
MTVESEFSLLVVDDEPDLLTLYELTLVREGYVLETAASLEEAMAYLRLRQYSAIITDMRLPDGSGLDLLQWLEASKRPEKAIVITAFGSAENAVEALKAGAYDYLTKPVDLRQFRMVVASALGRLPQAAAAVSPSPPHLAGDDASSLAPATDVQRTVSRRAAGPAAATKPVGLARMAGNSAALQQVRALIEKVARSMAPVLVQGESGTGKELVARAIHEVSPRASQPFIAVNCGAIPEQLLEAEFFGYRKGAFTGANEDREGFFQAANGGTLFLDEIGEMPLTMQSKLLRVIQERLVRPVGAVHELPINVRILGATHKDLGAEVLAGRFRQDLFYRLNVIQIRVPPLRERIEDLQSITEHVLERIARDAGVSPVPRLTPAALSHLARYAFPGNVRELENLLHRALALSDGHRIDLEDLALPDAAFSDSSHSGFDELGGLGNRDPAEQSLHVDQALPSDLALHMDEIERDILLRALERHRGNRTAAGASLGLSLRQMRYRMARLGVAAADAQAADTDGGSSGGHGSQQR